jgi:hypothetical protein
MPQMSPIAMEWPHARSATPDRCTQPFVSARRVAYCGVRGRGRTAHATARCPRCSISWDTSSSTATRKLATTAAPPPTAYDCTMTRRRRRRRARRGSRCGCCRAASRSKARTRTCLCTACCTARRRRGAGGLIVGQHDGWQAWCLRLLATMLEPCQASRPECMNGWAQRCANTVVLGDDSGSRAALAQDQDDAYACLGLVYGAQPPTGIFC